MLISSNLVAQEKINIDSSDVKTIDGIVNKVFELISGKEGKVRDWDAFRNLFLPTAHFTVLYHDDIFPQPLETVNLEELILLMHDEYYAQGFYQHETGKVIDEYNGIANVFQSWYAKDSEDQEDVGISSYQLVFFNDRWWIVNTVWTSASNDIEIPKRYLDK